MIWYKEDNNERRLTNDQSADQNVYRAVRCDPSQWRHGLGDLDASRTHYQGGVLMETKHTPTPQPDCMSYRCPVDPGLAGLPNAKHSPLPWNLAGPSNFAIQSDTQDGRFLIGVMHHGSEKAPINCREILPEIAQANAAFIVRACNEYDDLKKHIEDGHLIRDELRRINADLVAALELLLYGAKEAVKNGLVQPQINGGIVMAEAALAKAKGAA